MRGYRDIAADLRQRIDSGLFPPGSVLPRMTDLETEYGVSRQTIRAAINRLATEGLVATAKKRGTVVRDRRPIRIPLSRYGQVLTPGGHRGPWETACAAQGLDGDMRLVAVERVPASGDVAELLEVSPDDELIHRVRHAYADGDVVQLQHAWYPAGLVNGTAIAERGKVVGGVYGVLTAAGHQPTSCNEHVQARFPTDDEETDLGIGSGVPVLTIQRVTRDAGGKTLELLRVVSAADRTELIYDDLPLSEGGR